MSLNIAQHLKLPDEAVTQTFAILAKRGMGKTYTGMVMSEEMLKAGAQVIVVDPIGVWYGLRSSADGKKPGLSIVIAGGEHADFPIQPDNGEVLAEAVVKNRLSIILDLSLFRKNESVKFMTDFAETLYRRNRQAVHLFLDEADAFAPQRPMPNEARMLGAMEDIVRRGRARGIGVTMITQRPSVLNKNVLTQIEVLVALRLTAPLDQKAVDEWIRTHAEEGQRSEFMSSLPSLPIGEAWFWSPGWLNIFQRVKVRTRITLDSSSTPKAGQSVATIQKMAVVDIDKIRTQLAATIGEVEKTDPKALRRQVSDLKKQLADQRPKVEVREVVREVIPDNVRKLVEQLGARYDDLVEAMNAGTTHDDPRLPTRPKTNPAAETKTEFKLESKLKAGEQRMLEVLGRGYPLHFTKSQMASLAKMKVTGGTFGTYYGNLRRGGYLEEVGGNVKITRAGLDLLGVPATQPPQSGAEQIAMWQSVMRAGERRLFDIILDWGHNGITKELLANQAEMVATGGTFGTYLGTLRRNGLIEVDGDTIHVSRDLIAGNPELLK
jgi:hypothetical protein